jgi:hypothetical protein
LVTRCHGGGRGSEVAGWARGAERPGHGEPGALRRFSGGSGDALMVVCVRGCGRREDQGEVGLRRNCELGSPGVRELELSCARAQSVRFLVLERADWLRSVAGIVRHFSL